jgi:glycosyltransferase involved in cell wall biosynthesis
MTDPAPVAQPPGDAGRSLPGPVPGRTGWPWDAAVPDPGDPPAGGWPRITLVTPSFNQGRFIEETLRSVVLQGYPDLEWFVMDGGSTDPSVDLIKRYSPWMTEWRSARDRGQCDAINRGLERATGSLVGWLNSDDILMPGALHAFARAFAAHPSAVMVAGVGIDTDADSREIGRFVPVSGDRQRLALWNAPGGSVICQPASMMRFAALRRVGLLDEGLHNALDVDLWLRLAAIGEIVVRQETFATNRIHPEAKTHKLVVPRIIEHASIILRHGFRSEAQQYLAWNLPELYHAMGNPVEPLSRMPWRLLVGALRRKVLRRWGS